MSEERPTAACRTIAVSPAPTFGSGWPALRSGAAKSAGKKISGD